MNISENASYSIQFKGRRTGPFAFPVIREKYQNHEIGGLHQLITPEGKIPLAEVFSSPSSTPPANENSPPEETSSPAPSGESSSTRKISLQPSTPPEATRSLWFWKNQERHGPYTEGELKDLFQSNHLQSHDLIWQKEASRWAPLQEVFPQWK